MLDYKGVKMRRHAYLLTHITQIKFVYYKSVLLRVVRPGMIGNKTSNFKLPCGLKEHYCSIL